MVNDPIGDLIIRLKNATDVGKKTVSVPFSKLKLSVALTLKKAGYVGEIEEKGDGIGKELVIELLYGTDSTPKIHGVKRISKPGRRLYTKSSHIFPVKYGKGALILTTPKGIMTDAEARKDRVGGETMFTIW